MEQREGFHWYTVQVVSKCEAKVKREILERAAKQGFSDDLGEIFVPKSDDAKGDAIRGYIFIHMNGRNEVFDLIKRVPNFMRFITSSGSNKPNILSDSQIQNMRVQISSPVKVKEVGYNIGDKIKIKEGSFQSFIGTIDAPINDKGMVRVTISIFGRTTPVELSPSQFEKLED